jgi:hypothetical protein
MRKHLTIAGALFGLLMAGPAFPQTANPPSGAAPPTKLSEARCEVVWARINVARGPGVTQPQAEDALTSSNFSSADTNRDGVVSHAEFLVACDKGMVSETGSGSRAMGPPAAPQSKK